MNDHKEKRKKDTGERNVQDALWFDVGTGICRFAASVICDLRIDCDVRFRENLQDREGE